MTTHRSFTPEFKAQVVLEVLTGVRSASEACQHYQLKPDLVSRWKAQFLEKAATVFTSEVQNDPAVARVAELERLVGRLTLELEVSKKSLQHFAVPLEQRREVMRQLTESYPVPIICRVWETPRSTYYYQSQAREEHELRTALQRLAGEWPRYGSRRLTAQLQREGFQVNRKHIQRLMRELGLQGHHYAKKRRTTNSEHGFPRYANLVEQLEIVRPEQVWVSDITYIRVREEFVYLAVLMDVFTQSIRGWHLGRSLDQSLTLRALEHALAQHRPEIHHSDQGMQYAASAYTARLQQAGVQISMAEVGAAWQNGYAERLMRTIKEEEVDLSEYEDYTDAIRQLGRFLDEVYMHKRIHSSLGYLTPAEFEQQWLTQQADQPAIR